jgi:hypothetical protein
MKHELGKYEWSYYIAPKVDDTGNISGSYFLYSKGGYECKPVKLKSGKPYKKSFE